MIEFLIQDVRSGLRRFARLPVFAATGILTIATAIGASTAIFGVLHAALFYHLPFSEPERLVSISNQAQFSTMSRADFYDSVRRVSNLQEVAEYHLSGVNLVTPAVVQRRSAAEVSSTFLSVLGVKPILGRAFAADEDQPGHDSVVVISYGLWQEAFHGDFGVIGKRISLNGLTFAVVGVLPRGMDFPLQTDIWAPTIFDSNTYLREGASFEISAIGRISGRNRLRLVQAEMDALARQNLQAGESSGPDALPKIELLEAQLTHKIRPTLLMLNLAVIFVLLIMCANVAHLILVHTTARMGEIAVRSALGASRWLVVQERIVEAMLLSISGGLVGIGLGFVATRALYRVAPDALGQFAAVRFAWPTALYAILATVITGIAAGLIPAWFVVRHSPTSVLGGAGSRRSTRSGRLYNRLVTSEIALALVLLVGAGVFLRSLSDLNRSLFAYDTHGLLTFSLSPHGEKYVDSKGRAINTKAINAFYAQVLASLQNLPGVVSSAAISRPPIVAEGDNMVPVAIGQKAVQPVPGTEYIVSPSYFRTMGIRIVDGSVPAMSELAGGRFVIVGQDFARQLWQDERAVDKQLILPLHGPLPYRVVAVAANSYAGHQTNALSPELYLLLNQVYCPSATFILRTRQEPTLLLPFVQQAVAAIDSDQPVFAARTMDDRIASNEANQRFALFVLSGFAAIAVFLSIGGLYSATSMNLQSRIHEIGIRMALGAGRTRILRMLLLDGCKLSLPGIFLGAIGVLLLLRGASVMVFGSSTIRVLDVCLIIGLFFFTTVIATFLAAKRAARQDPGELLRVE